MYTAKPQLTDGEILREGSRLMALQLWVFWVGRGKCVLVQPLLWGKKIFKLEGVLVEFGSHVPFLSV